MAQLILTPQGVYKYFRALTIGFDPAGSEGSAGQYIAASISGAVTPLSYFKLGTGGPTTTPWSTYGEETTELTERFYAANCKDENSGKGDLNSVLKLVAATDAVHPTTSTKLLTAGNFYNYGNSNASKVAGILAVSPILSPDAGYNAWWNIPGVLFQVGCHLTTAEGNFYAKNDLAHTPDTALVGSDTVRVNEVGIFDEDDVMIFYGVFPVQTKNSETTLKTNCVAMLKTLDYQLVLA